MITSKVDNVELKSWKTILQQSYLSWDDLLKYLKIRVEDISGLNTLESSFPLRVTRQYASRIEKGNLEDPLLKQVLPIKLEKKFNPLYSIDPVQEIGTKQQPNILINKYQGRALMVATGSCAIHCRYCFRRHYPYSEKIGEKKISSALDELATRKDINELIISGGDPLILDDSKLEKILEVASSYSHIKRIRFHTRVPVVFPERVTPGFLQTISSYSPLLVIVTHINHPNEIDTNVAQAMNLIRNQKIVLLNQSVLLRGVNDNIDTLLRLSHKLFEVGILPYYMHVLDKVAGAAHFDLPRSTAQLLQTKLQELLPAYLVPRFVEEIPGQPSKISISRR